MKKPTNPDTLNYQLPANYEPMRLVDWGYTLGAVLGGIALGACMGLLLGSILSVGCGL